MAMSTIIPGKGWIPCRFMVWQNASPVNGTHQKTVNPSYTSQSQSCCLSARNRPHFPTKTLAQCSTAQNARSWQLRSQKPGRVKGHLALADFRPINACESLSPYSLPEYGDGNESFEVLHSQIFEFFGELSARVSNKRVYFKSFDGVVLMWRDMGDIIKWTVAMWQKIVQFEYIDLFS